MALNLVGPRPPVSPLVPAVAVPLTDNKIPIYLIQLVLEYLYSSTFSFCLLGQAEQINMAQIATMQQGEGTSDMVALTTYAADKKLTLHPEGRVISFKEQQHERFYYFQMIRDYLFVDCTLIRHFKIFKMINNVFETMVSLSYRRANDPISAFALSKDYVFIGFESGRLLRYNLITKKSAVEIFQSCIIAISTQFKNRLLVITRGKIYKLTTSFGPLKTVNSIQQYACFTKNHLFICRNTTTSIFHLPTLKKVGELPTGKVTAISANQEGVLAVIIEFATVAFYSFLPPFQELSRYRVDFATEKCAIGKNRLYLQGLGQGFLYHIPFLLP